MHPVAPDNDQVEQAVSQGSQRVVAMSAKYPSGQATSQVFVPGYKKYPELHEVQDWVPESQVLHGHSHATHTLACITKPSTH